MNWRGLQELARYHAGRIADRAIDRFIAIVAEAHGPECAYPDAALASVTFAIAEHDREEGNGRGNTQ